LQVKATPRFERLLKRLPHDRQKLLLERASELESEPYLGKRLTGPLRGLLSLRVGDYRVIYHVDPAKNTVWVIAVGHRKSIYE
jgi:mRNA interferase RelE/StbE